LVIGALALFPKECDFFQSNSYRPESAYEIMSLRKIVIKYNLEEYFGINVQMKVIDLEF
jgi:hypothetical protein